MKQELAEGILRCMKIREESYDNTAAAQAAPNPGSHGYLGTDWSKFYTKTIEEACKEGCPEYDVLIASMLHTMWNNAREWAEGAISEM